VKNISKYSREQQEKVSMREGFSLKNIRGVLIVKSKRPPRMIGE